MIYKTLNQEAKNWWWHKDLRKRGQLKEARFREQRHILNNVESLRDVLQFGGALMLGNAGWSLKTCEHPSKYSDNSSTSSVLSGYYNHNDQCYFEPICLKLGIPIIDTRQIDRFKACTMPLLGSKHPLPFNNVLNWAIKNEYKLITHNIKEV